MKDGWTAEEQACANKLTVSPVDVPSSSVTNGDLRKHWQTIRTTLTQMAPTTSSLFPAFVHATLTSWWGTTFTKIVQQGVGYTYEAQGLKQVCPQVGERQIYFLTSTDAAWVHAGLEALVCRRIISGEAWHRENLFQLQHGGIRQPDKFNPMSGIATNGQYVV